MGTSWLRISSQEYQPGSKLLLFKAMLKFMGRQIAIIKNAPHPGCSCSLSYKAAKSGGGAFSPWATSPMGDEHWAGPRTTVKTSSDWILMLSSPPSCSLGSPVPAHFCSLLTPTVAPFWGQLALQSAGLARMRHTGYYYQVFSF